MCSILGEVGAELNHSILGLLTLKTCCPLATLMIIVEEFFNFIFWNAHLFVRRDWGGADAEIGNLACLLWHFQGAEWIRVSTGRLDKVVHGFLWRVANANCTCKAVAWAKVTHGEISPFAGWTDKSSRHKSQGIMQQSTVRKHSLQAIATSKDECGQSETCYWRKILVGLQESENNNSSADIVD